MADELIAIRALCVWSLRTAGPLRLHTQRCATGQEHSCGMCSDAPLHCCCWRQGAEGGDDPAPPRSQPFQNTAAKMGGREQSGTILRDSPDHQESGRLAPYDWSKVCLAAMRGPPPHPILPNVQSRVYRVSSRPCCRWKTNLAVLLCFNRTFAHRSAFVYS